MLTSSLACKHPPVVLQFTQAFRAIDSLRMQGFTVDHLEMDGYTRPTLTVQYDHRCRAYQQSGRAVRYSHGVDHRGRFEKYQFQQNQCRIIWEVR
ncbi:MAG: hypothetical protein ACMZI0_20320 [Symbiopectobacterium sp.]|uniref:hypothetical protein n=1 Tax=Symbiopectobacterium sp. TaxID=2952789 RepID=UPI0039EC1A4F